MKKLILPLLLISNIAFATSSGTATLEYFDSERHPIKRGYDARFSSDHTAHITNDTGIIQPHIAICYAIVACQEYPDFTRFVNFCEYHDINIGETINLHKAMHLTVNYNFTGWCRIFSQTEVHGFSHIIIQDNKRLQVK